MRLSGLLEAPENIRVVKINWVDAENADGSLLALRELYHWGDDVINFDACDAKLTSLEGAPTSCRDHFSVRRNRELSSLIGGPKSVGSYFVNSCGLTSLEGAPEICDTVFNCAENKLSSLEGIGRKYLKECNKVILTKNSFRSNVLGLLLVKGLEQIGWSVSGRPEPSNPFYILQSEFVEQKNFNIIDAKERLMEAGLKEFAKL